MKNGQARAEKSAFRQAVTVSVDIASAPARVWALLTDAAGFPRWNSTVTSIEGPIELGKKLAIRVPISPRVFTPRVTAFESNRRMVWRDGAAPMFQGVRVYEITPKDGGSCFTMTETFSGLMLPMIAGSLPDFVPVFTQYAADLKHAAEAAA
ncbi:MAG: SRPBCC domain-containing protein [Hyphomonadaceae bacterium]|nr:SRPBCC domain-containing protein [Hyphomonadaceae bacterium]MBP9233677.1 SRPBCC domain-containing protein [Hyphomonadaceae bacterium]